MQHTRYSVFRAAAPVTLFYDGRCPFCLKEIAWLSRHRHRSRIALVDIRAPGFEPAASGPGFDALMGKLHVQDQREEWYIGMDASRALYAVLGYRRLVWLSCLPGLRGAMNAGYRLFARHRVRLGQWYKRF